MCGIVGIIGGSNGRDAMAAALARMQAIIAYRGPDGHDIMIDTQQRFPVGFGHRRLAIIDPEGGAQPMKTADGQLTVVFNGAIYNHVELRTLLADKGHAFRTHSDTEVILHAYREWGDDCVKHFNGMFAFALWDAKRSRVFCARDRIGIKPFYFRADANTVLFASEIKALLVADNRPVEMNPDGLKDYLTFQFTMGSKTMFQGIEKLEPGETLVIEGAKGALEYRPQRYWKADYTIDPGITYNEAVEHLRFLLEDAVRLQLRSDVPLGAYLSGGLDSSTIVGMAARTLGDANIQTFTGAFREGLEYDETRYAKQVAEAARAQYHEIYISGDHFAQTLPKLMFHMDEPAAGPGLYPQYFVSQLAAKHVKVCLGGQGGDELFVGYARYLVAYLEQSLKTSIYPDAAIAGDVGLAEISANLRTLAQYQPMMQQLLRSGLFGEPVQRYFQLVERTEGTRGLVNPDVWSGSYKPYDTFEQVFNTYDGPLINRMLHVDLVGSLPALLQVEDRASMAASLESRVPLLDHRIVEYMNKLPVAVKFAGGETKKVFKDTVRPHVPEAIINRTDKMGFPMPIDQWLKGPAREFVMDSLLSSKALSRGLFDPAAVEDTLNGSGKYSRVLWGMLCLEHWNRQFMDGEFRHQMPMAA